MPCPWIYLKAQPSSAIQNLTASSVNVFLAMWNRKSPPLIRSTTRYLYAQIVSRGFNSNVAGPLCLHVLDILETVPQVTDERMIYLLQHAALTYDIADTLGSYN